MKSLKVRDDLSVPQKHIEYGPSSTGGPDPLNDQSDKVKISVSEGKTGSSVSSKVQSFSKNAGEL